MPGRARDTGSQKPNKYVETAYWRPIFNVRQSQGKMTLWPIQNCTFEELVRRIVQALQILENNLYFSLPTLAPLPALPAQSLPAVEDLLQLALAVVTRNSF